MKVEYLESLGLHVRAKLPPGSAFVLLVVEPESGHVDCATNLAHEIVPVYLRTLADYGAPRLDVRRN